MTRGRLAGTPTPQGDVNALARKYKGQGQDPSRVYNTLRSLGYTDAEAKQAVAQAGATGTPTKKPAAPPAVGQGAAGGGGGSLKGSPSSAAPTGPKFEAPDLSKVTLTPPRKLNSGDLGGFLFGLFLYALGLNYLRSGPKGVKGWLSAKFLNQPVDLSEDPLSAAGSSTTATPSSGLSSTRAQAPAAI